MRLSETHSLILKCNVVNINWTPTIDKDSYVQKNCEKTEI